MGILRSGALAEAFHSIARIPILHSIEWEWDVDRMGNPHPANGNLPFANGKFPFPFESRMEFATQIPFGD